VGKIHHRGDWAGMSRGKASEGLAKLPAHQRRGRRGPSVPTWPSGQPDHLPVPQAMPISV